MSTVGFEPTVSAGERPQTYAFDIAAAGTGSSVLVEEILKIRVIYELCAPLHQHMRSITYNY